MIQLISGVLFEINTFNVMYFLLRQGQIYIIISVSSGKFWSPLVGIWRAIARWNRLDVKMMDRWEFFASRALCARSTRKCVPFTT